MATQKPPMSPAILLVDDEADTLFMYSTVLRAAGLNNIRTFEDSRQVLPFLAANEAGVIVLDLQMPNLSGAVLLEEIVCNFPHIPVLIVTASNELSSAVACMKAGAFDYIVKPVEKTGFIASILKALEISALRCEIASLRKSQQALHDSDDQAFAAIKTSSLKMKAIFSYLEGVAMTEQPVLVTGETGVGKELIARAIHELSDRKGPFVAVNSAGLDDQMFSDTLFGHLKGAFTGADKARDGMIAKAAHGTLFLDEIGEMGLSSQVKLLRLLQEREYYPLGSDRAVICNARIVAATNRDFRELIVKGDFRKDLYYRLDAHHVQIPPLRERYEDIPLLMEHFLHEAAGVLNKKIPTYPPDLLRHLMTYYFPGNVRELRAMIFDALARHKGGVMSIGPFRSAIDRGTALAEGYGVQSPGTAPLLNISGRFPTLKEMEATLLAEAMKVANSNQGAAAGLLGISRQALNRKLCGR